MSDVSERSVTNLEAVRLVLTRLHVVADWDAEQALIDMLGAPAGPVVISFVNQHALNLAWTRPGFAALLLSADVLLRDGVGIELCLKFLGRRCGVNMNGTDLIPRLARSYAGRRVALYGTTDPWTNRAAAALRAMGCDVVSTLDGFRSALEYVDETTRCAPEFVILAMGMPKQEIVAGAIADAVRRPIVIANGGAIADFLGGRVRRAPRLLRRLRLEWAFRLANEPRRLWGRYVRGGGAFAARVLQLRYRKSSAPLAVTASMLMIVGILGT